jgi:hypothetical protein
MAGEVYDRVRRCELEEGGHDSSAVDHRVALLDAMTKIGARR